MNKKTLKALKASIVKWEKNTKAETPDKYLIGYVDCPLCDLYWHNDCNGCPISQKTKKSYCSSTPYQKCNDHLDDWDHQFARGEDYAKAKRLAIAAARREIKFLKSLLPEGEQQ